MSRLIDADMLEPDADYDDGEAWAYSITQIENAPTVELELIRCKNCRHWSGGEVCEVWHCYISNDEFYCGCAERREE